MGYLILKCDVGKKNERIELEKLLRDGKWEAKNLNLKFVLKYGPIVLEMDPESFEQLREAMNGA